MTAATAAPQRVPLPYRVVRRCAETADTATFKLLPAGPALRPFRPGQFAMLYAFGVGGIPVSVSGLPTGEPALVHTVRAVGAVSRALYGLRAGDTVGVRGPYGNGWDLERAEGHDVLVIAGGIGLAPLRPLILDVLAKPARHGRLTVLIGARTPGDLLYRLQTRAWGAAARVAVTVDRPEAGWRGNVGVVTRLLGHGPWSPPGTCAFVCGPEPMIHAVAGHLMRAGVAPHRIQVSLERNMRCGEGTCGHCQLGPVLLCRDGPVTGWDRAAPLLAVKEL
ncbi:FAD/NAD(P)-binding protein [Streptomyces sp. MST-110588]|uniref:FAD/NAD(P)-binding protein n=1 Tax=Streptomyces sp. MST-110588 TaxID=2833628 RepID=UPI001F5E26E8|nr:FAD/NAD(P)-binding protein [Streptomyces sp. MST-110588]UNO43360.1 FAD/NAD(P)-binding protein [Streptomyces sp. MST-110588]